MQYAIDPNDLADALAATIPDPVLDTGWLPDGSTLRIWEQGRKRIVFNYREPQVTGLWFDGSDEPLRVPLPGLVLARTTDHKRFASYYVTAVTERPTANTICYEVPLPNIGVGGICWGTVKHPDADELTQPDMTPDWIRLLGSRFGNHAVRGKAKSESGDIRKLLIQLSEDAAQVYPMAELVETKKTFQQWVERVTR